VLESHRTTTELSYELAEELGVQPIVVRKAIKALSGRIVSSSAPNLGRGRGPRLYGGEAVAEIRNWIEEWKKGRRRRGAGASALWTRLDAIEEATHRLERVLEAAIQAGQKIRASCRGLRELSPIASSITVLGEGLAPRHPPIAVLLRPLKDGWSAALVDAPLWAEGSTPRAAVAALRRSLVSTYRRLSAEQPKDRKLWTTLEQLIRHAGKGKNTPRKD